MSDDSNHTTPADQLLRQFAGYRMKRAFLVIQEDLAETLAPLGLRLGTYSVLAVVAANNGMSQSQLSDVLNIKRSGVVALIDELEAAGVLVRKPVAGDRRTNALALTPAGRRLWTRSEAAVKAHEARILHALNDAEKEQLHDLLSRVAPPSDKGNRND